MAAAAVQRRPRSAAAAVQHLRTRSRGWSDICGTLVHGRGLQELPLAARTGGSPQWSCSPAGLPKVPPSMLLADSRPSPVPSAPAACVGNKAGRPHSAPKSFASARHQATGLSDRVARATHLSGDQRADCLERLGRLQNAKLANSDADEAESEFADSVTADQLTPESRQRLGGSRRSSNTGGSSSVAWLDSSRGQELCADEAGKELNSRAGADRAGLIGQGRASGSSAVPEQSSSRVPSATQPRSTIVDSPSGRPLSAIRAAQPAAVEAPARHSSRPSSAAHQDHQNNQRPCSAWSNTPDLDLVFTKVSGASSVEDAATPSSSSRSDATDPERRGSKASAPEKLEELWAAKKKEVKLRKLPAYCREMREELCRSILQYFLEHMRKELAVTKDEMPLSRQEMRESLQLTAVPDPKGLVKYLAETELHIKQGPQRRRIRPGAPLSTQVYRRLASERRKLAEHFHWDVMSKELREDVLFGLFFYGPFTWTRLLELISVSKSRPEAQEDLEQEKQVAQWEDDMKEARARGFRKQYTSISEIVSDSKIPGFLSAAPWWAAL